MIIPGTDSFEYARVDFESNGKKGEVRPAAAREE